MKNRIVTFSLFFLMLCGAAFCADQEKFSLTVGGMKVIELPFSLESYRVSAKDKLAVEEINPQQLRVIGKAIGECNLTVNGAGVSVSYSITIKSDISNTLKRLRVDLEDLPELDITINQDYIVIKGTVSDPRKWALLQKVLPLYKSNVHNFAEFRPTPETLLNLKKLLTESGFEFAAEGQLPQPGQLEMKITPDALIVNGELCSEDAVSKVKQLLGTQTWLDTSGANVDGSSGKIRGIVNLSVMQTVLTVDVVYVAVSESDARSSGSNETPSATLNLGWIFDMVAGRKDGETATFGGNMNQTVRFLASNGITRSYNAGHVSFLNHDGQGGTLHTGGTISVKVSGESNGDLKDIEYGLNITVSGGLVTPGRAQLKLDLSNSNLVSASGDAYTRSMDTTSQTVYCDLDKTLVVAGSRKLSQGIGQSGLPILRNIPVVKWFVANDSGNKEETRLLILVCPRIASASQETQIEIPLTEETKGAYAEGRGDLQKDEAERKAKLPWYKRWFSK